MGINRILGKKLNFINKSGVEINRAFSPNTEKPPIQNKIDKSIHIEDAKIEGRKNKSIRIKISCEKKNIM